MCTYILHLNQIFKIFFDKWSTPLQIPSAKQPCDNHCGSLWFNLILGSRLFCFLLFFGVEMHDNEFETKEFKTKFDQR